MNCPVCVAFGLTIPLIGKEPFCLRCDAVQSGEADGAVHNFRPSLFSDSAFLSAYREAYDKADAVAPLETFHPSPVNAV